MELTREQRRILDGVQGPLLANCMRWLVDWGDAMGARRLVPVANTHALVTVPGNLVRGAGQKPLEQAMELLRAACRHKVSCHSTVDPMNGQVIASGHPLEGETLRGKVLVIESTKGSSATPLVIGLAHREGNAPAAFVNTNVDCLAVLACVVNGIPMVADFEQDPFEIIHSGDHVEVDADGGKIVIVKRD